ncbi:hypothetical protein D3C83_138460 [compost metagenome]
MPEFVLAQAQHQRDANGQKQDFDPAVEHEVLHDRFHALLFFCVEGSGIGLVLRAERGYLRVGAKVNGAADRDLDRRDCGQRI